MTATDNVPPFFIRSQQAHTDAVVCVAALPDKPWVVSASHDGTARCWDGETEQKIPLPPAVSNDVTILPFSGPMVLGNHETFGLRVALAGHGRSADVPDLPAVLVWEPRTNAVISRPCFTLFIPRVRAVHALAWDETATALRVLAGVPDSTRPLCLSGTRKKISRLILLEFDLRGDIQAGEAAGSSRALPSPLNLRRFCRDRSPTGTASH